LPDIKTIQDQVQARMSEVEGLIGELGVELDQLKRIAGLLESTNGTPRSAARPARRAAVRSAAVAKSAPKARPQRGGNRAQQALKLIAAQPGLSAADLAASMGMKRNYLYRVLPALEREGRITKQGKGYHPAAAGPSA
jgi:hypothetical protein